MTWNYVYDLDGNLVEKNNGTAIGNEKWTYTWNEDNRLTQVTKGVWATGPVLNNVLTVSYQYDLMGRLLRRVNGTTVTTFEFDGWNYIGETTGSVTTRWNAPEGVLLSFERGGSVYQCHLDALLSCRVVTDSTGTVVARLETDAWGNSLAGSFDNVPNGGLPFTWVGAAGVRWDADIQMHLMRHRWYEPQVGRFVSRDPIGLSAGSNLYAYVNNNPVSRVDPSGLQPWSLGHRDVTLQQIQDAVRDTGVPDWVLNAMVHSRINSDDNNTLGKWAAASMGLTDVGLPPTRTRPAYEAYLRGLIPPPKNGRSFWELDWNQFNSAYQMVNDPCEQRRIYEKLHSVEGNLDTAAKALSDIARTMYGTTTGLSNDQWAWVIAQHDQGGPLGAKGVYAPPGRYSQKQVLHDNFLNAFDQGWAPKR